MIELSKKKYKALVKGVPIASNVKTADSFFKKLIGLLAHNKLYNGEGLLIKNCRQVHSFGMRFNIDVIFLSKSEEVLSVFINMRPGKISKHVKNAYYVLELESGIINKYNIKSGDTVLFE